MADDAETSGYESLLPEYIREMFKLQFAKEDEEMLRQTLQDMKGSVTVRLYTTKDKYRCFSCEETEKLLTIISNNAPMIGDRVALQLETKYVDGEVLDDFRKLGIDRIRVPTIVIPEANVVYLGMPAGEEIRAFIETLIRVSSRDTGLSDRALKDIADMEGQADIEVIVTPPCPYCPYAALMANMFAYASVLYGRGNIRSYIVEAYENPDIADRYAVTTVPTIAVNGRVVFVGLPYEMQLLKVVKRLAQIRA